MDIATTPLMGVLEAILLLVIALVQVNIRYALRKDHIVSENVLTN